MKKIVLLAGCALLAGMGSVKAQDVFGRVIMGPLFTVEQRLALAQNDYIYGTSRSAAMGGAFTSLGADLSSMNINPAGLGMYQSSDWGFTQALSINATKTDAPNMAAGSFSSGGNRTSYGLNNAAIAFNIFNRSGGFTSLTVGFGYNRAANFNQRSFVGTSGERTSIAEMFAQELNFALDEDMTAGDFSSSADPNPFYNEDIYLDEWGATLGYQTGLVGYDGSKFNWNGIGDPKNSYFQSVTKGGIYEYSVSAGANISNFLYLGATLGISQVNYKEDTSYEEEYSSALGSMWYDQHTKITGDGFTMKLGAIARPWPFLRLGLAFHLPTYYTLDKSYTSSMSAGNSVTRDSGDPLVDEPQYNTAPRLLVGISGVIADRAILAFDYERAWYNKMHLRSIYMEDVENSKTESARIYKPSNTFRAGLEILASHAVSLRAGGSYMANYMRDKYALTSNPTVKSAWSLAAGAGFNVGRNGYIDLSYTYQRANYTSYEHFYFDDGTNLVSQYDIVDGNDVSRYYTPKKNMHQITLTLGSRF